MHHSRQRVKPAAVQPIVMATGTLACFFRKKKMNVLIINCGPVKNGATAEIVKIAEECIKEYFIKQVKLAL